MNEKDPYTQALETAPVNPDRDFALAQKAPVYKGGSIANDNRSWFRDPGESGHIDNTMRKREMASDPLGMRNISVDSRSMSRAKFANMEIKPPADVLKAGKGIYG